MKTHEIVICLLIMAGFVAVDTIAMVALTERVNHNAKLIKLDHEFCVQCRDDQHEATVQILRHILKGDE